MKELSIEEKAKAYDEALEKGKQIQNTPYTAHWDIMKDVAEYLLPELKESEDEKIRKDIVFYIAAHHKDDGEKACWLYWLEKQGEQKPAEWNRNDRKHIEKLITIVDASQYKEEVEWLVSLLERTIPQPMQQWNEEKEALYDKPAWSEEDETNYNRLLHFLNGGGLIGGRREELFDWLKSLRHQNTWKPTEEQMEALNSLLLKGEITEIGQAPCLQSLYYSLKAL